MSCNIIYNDKGQIEKVVTDFGTPSKLFVEAKNKLGEKEALNLFYVSQSDEFKESLPKENKNPKIIAEKYTRLITNIKKEQPSLYWSVDIPSKSVIESAAENGRIVDVKGGMGIVTEDGDMIGLFKYDSSQSGTAAAVQGARIKLGGIKLDNFDGYLTRVYKRNGFRVVAKTPFNEKYAPEGWNKEKHGTPDVVFMIYDPNNILDFKEKTFSNYEKAKSYRDSFVEQAKINKGIISQKEPSLESVVQFITSKNASNKTMDSIEIQSFKNALISTPEFTYNNLQKAFYDENGIFFVSPSKLISSGLYSQYEAEHLKKDIELQKIVKTAIENLKNTDEIIPIEQNFDLVEKENEFNSFGKLNNLNPYIIQKAIQNTLAATTQQEFDENIEELPFSNFQKTVNKKELFNEMQAYKKAEVMMSINGIIKTSNNSNTEVIVPQTAEDLTGTKVLFDVKNFMSQNLNILKTMEEDSSILLKGIEERLIEKGYDVIGLSSKAPSVSMMEYFRALSNLSDNASRDSLNEYVKIYDNFFEKDLSPEKGFVKTIQNDRNFVKLDSNLKEEDSYNQQGLIKQKEDTYIKVNKKTAEELYSILITYPEKLPPGITTEDQLKKYIQSKSNNDEVSDTETAETINLFKLYYSIPLEQQVSKKDTSDFSKKRAQFTGNIEYLSNDFVGDFYKKGLKEKVKESNLWKDFYIHFKVTEKGLELVNDDPITLDLIQPYITEDLKNYSLLSKSMPNLNMEEIEFIDDKNSRRSFVSNYPETLTKFEGNISIIDNNNIVIKNINNEFIKLKNDVFENVSSIGNLTLYVKLDKSTGNLINFNVEAPISNYFLEDYLYLDNKPEVFTKTKNYLSKTEKEKLAKDEFGCI